MLNTFVTHEIWSPRKSKMELKMLDYKIAEEYLSSCNVFKSALLVTAQPSMETLEPNYKIKAFFWKYKYLSSTVRQEAIEIIWNLFRCEVNLSFACYYSQ